MHFAAHSQPMFFSAATLQYIDIVVVNCLDTYLYIFVFSAVRRIFFPKLQTIARKKYSGKGEINI